MKIFNTLLVILVSTMISTACSKKRQNPSSEELIETIELSSVSEEKEPTNELGVEEEKEELVEQKVVEKAPEAETKKLEKPAITKDKEKGLHFYNVGLDFARKKQFKKAADAYLTACQLGNAPGCHKFGWQLQKEGNFKGASKFYAYACKEGVNKSCNNLGFIAEKDKKLHKAEDYYSWGCIRGYQSACKSLKRVNTELRQAH